MIALRSENTDYDVCDLVCNERSELDQLKDNFNGNKIGHGSSCVVLSDRSVHLYDEVSHTWVEL